MNNRFGKLSLVLAFAMIALSACVGGGSKSSVTNSDGNGAEKSAAPSGSPKHDPVMLTFFEGSSGNSMDKFMNDYGNDIQKKFPWVTIDFKFVQNVNGKSVTLSNMLAAGENIDIVISSVGSLIPNLIDSGLQYDHNELIQKYHYDMSKYDPTTIQLLTNLTGGKVLGLPFSASTNEIVYNRDIFDKFGVPYPKDGMTWDEVYELAKKLTRRESDVQYRGMVIEPSHFALANQLSASYVDPKTAKPLFSSDPRWAKHAQNIKRFYEIPGNEVDAKSVTQAHNMFYKDKIAAMYINSLTPDWLDPATHDVNADAVSLPEYSDLPGVGPQWYPSYLSITNTSKNKDAAFEVITWMTSEEYQMERVKKGYPSVLKNPELRDALSQDLPNLKGRNVKAFVPVKAAAPSLLTPYNTVANTEFYNQIQKYLTSQTDLNTMLRQTDENVAAKIADAKSKEKK